jgi:hypothetical protein
MELEPTLSQPSWSWPSEAPPRQRRLRRRPLKPLDQIRLDTLRIDQLRGAVRGNHVSFPSPVPTFERHDRPDLQWKLVQLYFVLGWSCESIARRYGLIHQRVRQILNTWKRRAVEMGYIQYIPPAQVLWAASPKRSAQTFQPGFEPFPPPPPQAAESPANLQGF